MDQSVLNNQYVCVPPSRPPLLVPPRARSGPQSAMISTEEERVLWDTRILALRSLFTRLTEIQSTLLDDTSLPLPPLDLYRLTFFSLYGEHAERILHLLSLAPLETLPVVLSRITGRIQRLESARKVRFCCLVHVLSLMRR